MNLDHSVAVGISLNDAGPSAQHHQDLADAPSGMVENISDFGGSALAPRLKHVQLVRAQTRESLMAVRRFRRRPV
jgi:hypothetical protein